MLAIASDILTEALPEGALLPAEPQMGEQFRVRRTVVRESAARLQRMGLVRVRQGHGTVVRPRAEWHEFDPDLNAVPASTGQITDLTADLLEIRRMVEVESAGLAAERRSNSDLDLLRLHLETMENALDKPDKYNDADIAFHDVLITATQNDLMRQMMRPVNELRRIGSSITTARSQGSMDASIAGHRLNLDAVERHDAAAACDAMKHHISQFEQDLITASAARESLERQPAAREAI